MSGEWEISADDRAQFLGRAMEERAQLLRLASEGRYGEAHELSSQFIQPVLDALPASPDEVAARGVADLLGGIAFLLDASIAAIAVGRNDEAANVLHRLSLATEILGATADRIVAIGIRYCKDGRPSLDGECLQKPPCPP